MSDTELAAMQWLPIQQQNIYEEVGWICGWEWHDGLNTATALSMPTIFYSPSIQNLIALNDNYF